MVHDMGSSVLVTRQNDLDAEIVSNGKLKELQEHGSERCKGGVGVMRMVNVPLVCNANEGPLEEA